ncbi:hypothetical protein SLS60_006021 [Paraconiothyrium brasiliense]|uniref:Uncharacterized protein n=1 Tax=Paraconiothyrium brasiliense TaxID=300254 RepID=A0ABR3RDU2_9PLEO
MALGQDFDPYYTHLQSYYCILYPPIYQFFHKYSSIENRASSSASARRAPAFDFPVDQVEVDLNAPTPEPFHNGLRIFEIAPVNWVGNDECNLHSTAILTQYEYHGIEFYFTVFEVSSNEGTTMKYGWLPFAYAGVFLEREWESYKNDTKEFPHSDIIKDLREEVANRLSDLLHQSVTEGGEATRSLAEDMMILALSGQLADQMDNHVAAMKAKAEEIQELDEELDEILETYPSDAQENGDGA